MYPRKKLDWSFSELLAGLWFVLTRWSDRHARSLIASRWGPHSVPFFSVRTGWDALLRTFNDGDTIAMSDVTIPHMRDLVVENGCRVIAIDVSADTLCVDVLELERAFRNHAPRAFIFVHLFGSRADLTGVRKLCDKYNVLLVEDCAQSYVGYPEFDPIGDVAMYSFGTIKTATCMGGSMFVFRDPKLAKRTEENANHSKQSRLAYGFKLFKSAAFLVLGNRFVFTLFVKVSADHDQTIRRLSRGFSGDDWPTKIRHAPSVPLLEMMAWRFETYKPTGVWTRRAAGEFANATLNIVGSRARRRTHWLLAVIPEDADRFVEAARRKGLDATRGTSVLCSISPRSSAWIDSIVYLPCYGDLNATTYETLRSEPTISKRIAA